MVAGTFVVQGEGEGVVEAIGVNTTIAGIAALTRQAHRPPSPLTVQLSRVVKIIAVIAKVWRSGSTRPRPSCSPSASALRWFPKGCFQQ